MSSRAGTDSVNGTIKNKPHTHTHTSTRNPNIESCFFLGINVNIKGKGKKTKDKNQPHTQHTHTHTLNSVDIYLTKSSTEISRTYLVIDMDMIILGGFSSGRG